MNENKFLKNETLLQTLKRLNKQMKTEQTSERKNIVEKKTYKKDKYKEDKTNDDHCLICDDSILTSKDCETDFCKAILNNCQTNDDLTSYNSDNSFKKKNIETNSILSLDNDENSLMFVKIISNLEERLNDLENKKKKKKDPSNQ